MCHVFSAIALFVLAFVDVPRGEAQSRITFTRLELGSAPGTVCPGSSSCTNGAAEPAIRADNDGDFYASSENGTGAGTNAWRSTDGGLHYTTLASPNQLSGGAGGGFSPAGGDTDLAVAPVKNLAGFYNVYVASLSLANVEVSTSRDGGASWQVNMTGAQIPGDDREWIAADGASKVCISYHDLATSNLNVDCSLDEGTSFTQHASAIDTAHAFLIGQNEIGNLAIDPANHAVYQVFNGIADAAETACTGCGFHAVWAAVSTDGGATFTDHPVYVNPDSSADYGHSFVNVSVDRGGNVYAVFSDDHNVSFSFSTDGGRTWSASAQVNGRPARTAIFPWSVAGDAGKLDVVFYGSGHFDGVNPPDGYPPSAAWYVFLAQDLQATTPGSSFTQVRATRVVHRGGVCESGVTCTGNRDLFDDFGVAASPGTGRASIAYSDDQFHRDTKNPPQPGCTRDQRNSPACDHTAVGTQITGPGIFGP